MSLLMKGDVVTQYRYITIVKLLFSDGSIMDIDSSRITGVTIEDSYETAKLPIFKLSMIVESSTFFKIMEDRRDIKINVRIQKYHRKSKQRGKSMVRDVFNKVFGLYIDEEPEDIQRNLKKKAKVYKDENRLEKLTNTIDLFLFDTDLIDGLLQPSNDIISNCSMSTLVSSLLYNAGCRKILMSPIDNVKIYDRIILPPQSIYDNIKYLDTYYGLYKTGSLLYFGLERAYLLRYGPFNDTFEKGEYTQTTILISRSDSSEISQNGEILREGENQNYINASAATVQFVNNITSLDLTVGMDTSIITAAENKIDKLVNESELTGGDGLYRYICNDTQNKYITKTYWQQLKGQERQVNFLITDHDISALTPNKNINIVFEDPKLVSKYNGVYKLSAVIHKLIRDGSDFTIASSLSLKKMK